VYEQTLFFGDKKTINMILDDGGDLTKFLRLPEFSCWNQGYLKKTTTGVLDCA
jgi:S-adenosylhomocysteine hydrolase